MPENLSSTRVFCRYLMLIKIIQDSQRFIGEARTRILFWYLVLMIFFLMVSLPTTRKKVFERVNERVRQDLVEEVESFRELLAGKYTEEDEKLFQKLSDESEDGDIVPNGRPKSTLQLLTLFEVYLRRRIPEDDTFLITIVNGEFNKSSPRALPQELNRDSSVMKKWKSINNITQNTGKIEIQEQDDILYITKNIVIDNSNQGVLVVVHTTAGEKLEALEALEEVLEVKIIVLCLAIVLAWFVAGNILAPLRQLSHTAHQISETDLTQRLPVKGNGEIAELSRTFNEMMDRLEYAFAAQRNFVNDAGHELRTPITIVRGHLELMGDDPAEQQETIDLVIDELDRMNRLVEDLLLLAKSERPDFLQLETVDLAVLTQELFAKAQALAERDWQLDEVANGKIVVDRQRITEAILNLAENAVQHTRKTDIIAIGSTIDQKEIHLWVRDGGEGIEPQDKERIFERFARASNARRRSDGSGLGLSIVKAIAEAHHGKITLASELGTGSTFTIVIPLVSN
jgi:signal transduction histidine kinase